MIITLFCYFISDMLIKLWYKPILSSIKRCLVELFKLIKTAMPIVKNLVKVNEVHCYLLNKILVKLVLVNVHMHILYFWMLILKSLQESLLLIQLLLMNFKYYLADFSAKTCSLFAVVLLWMLKEGCACVQSC